ncbi:MAG: hypothetical protein NZM35_01745 [Chitinophagales bacterium]|nr:hypothetical protein [Chitinophagales bacterium]MDW8419300.1 hypothetical protein [Chitinophagales bacterium]
MKSKPRHSKLFMLLLSVPGEHTKWLAEQAVHLQKRSQHLLFKILFEHLPTQKEPDRASAFKFIFGKTYTKNKDYLLRNEYRLLYQWAKKSLSEKYIPYNARPYIYLEYLLHNSIYELFEEEYKAEWEKAINVDDSALLLELIDLNIQYHFTGKPQSLAISEQIKHLCIERLHWLQKHLLREIRKEELRLRLAERIIGAYNPRYVSETLPTTIELAELQKTDRHAQYISKKVSINGAQGLEKIYQIKALLKNTSLIKKYEPNYEGALCRFLVNIAIEYYLLNKIEHALNYFKKAEKYIVHASHDIVVTFAFNYSMSLLRAEQHHKSKEIAYTYKNVLLQNPLIKSRAYYLLCILELYAGNYEAAEEFIRLETKKEGTEFYYLMRLALSAVYYLRGDLDLAIRETINVEQAIHYELSKIKSAQTIIGKNISQYFRKFYHTLTHYVGRDRKPELEKLRNSIDEISKTENILSPNSILLHWLRNEITKLTN